MKHLAQTEAERLKLALQRDILRYNFYITDAKKHGTQILEQMWYEFYIGNAHISPV